MRNMLALTNHEEQHGDEHCDTSKLVEEQKTIRADIGKLHAEIWRLVRGRNSAFVDQIAQCKLDIQSKTRRVKTIDYLLAYMNGKTIALSC